MKTPISRTRFLLYHIGYGFVEFANPEIAKKVLTTLNGSVIPGQSKAFKLNWATHNLNSSGKDPLTGASIVSS